MPVAEGMIKSIFVDRRVVTVTYTTGRVATHHCVTRAEHQELVQNVFEEFNRQRDPHRKET